MSTPEPEIKSKTKTLACYMSMAQAARDLKIPKSILIQAKKDPQCTAFHASGRIFKKLLEDYLKTFGKNLMDEMAKGENYNEWKLRKLKAEAQTAELELEEARDKYLDKEQVLAFLRSICLSQKALLKSRFCMELPPKLIGLDQISMQLLIEKELESVCKLLQDSVDNYDLNHEPEEKPVSLGNKYVKELEI
jgi:hypothetical protein